jgi:hypothetical protein
MAAPYYRQQARRSSDRVRVQLRLRPALRDRLLQEARDNGVTLNAYVESALGVYLEFLQDQARPGRASTSQERPSS